jgi:hypothetical protein
VILRRNIVEIAEDSALLFYGAALSLAYLITAFFLVAHNHYVGIVSRNVPPICWPYFESCYRYRTWSDFTLYLAISSLGLGSLFAFVLFLKRKVGLAYFFLTFIAFIHLILISLDFRNTQNQYYMLMWITFAYLFWPGKRSVIHYLALSFYFWAGRLKLNWQWLSGYNLYRDLWLIPKPLYSAACIYVVILEMFMIWGLVARNRIWFWATLIQLVFFHVISASQIGYYYPALMLTLLTIYPLSRSDRQSERWLGLKPSGFVLVALFAFFQIYPSLVSRKSEISGVGRTFALNMFEGIYDCNVYWVEHFKDGRTVRVDVMDRETERLRCEPIYYYSKTLNQCRSGATDANFLDLDFFMDVGIRSVTELTPVIHQSNFCATKPAFNLFLPNTWME